MQEKIHLVKFILMKLGGKRDSDFLFKLEYFSIPFQTAEKSHQLA